MHVPSPDVGLWDRGEISASLLLALPWTALSWYYKHHADAALSHTTAPEEGSSVLSTQHVDGIASRTCALTALTMIIFGIGQMLRTGGSAVVASPKVDVDIAKGALLRALSIALPIYATLKVGGFLVAFTMLLAMASGVPTITQPSMPASGQPQFSQKKLTVGFIVTVIVLNYLGLSASMEPRPLIGYVGLLCSIFLVRPPFSGQTPSSIAVPGLGISGPGISTPQQKSSSMASPVISSEESVVIAFVGLLLGIATFIFGGISVGASHALHLLSVAGAVAACLTYVVPTDIRSPQKLGMAISTGGAALLCAPPLQSGVQVTYLFRCMLSAIGFFVARFDDSHLRFGAHTHTQHSHHDGDASRVSKLIIRYSEPYPLLYSIVKESDSRKIFYFMSLNFAFMLVQLSYGFLTGSLGLLSDSIHMFFDCLALVVGLCAAVMSKWPPSARFPYGYGKVDTLSGFANGIFLMIISIEIIYEAVERLSTGSQVHRIGELLLVSIAGLGVNLVGIMAFEHGHGHGHDHSHHGHSHSHGNENMHGIFLHILADTLGSVAVVISTVLVHYSGWPGYDPIASCLIAILIFASAVPLVSSTAKSLLLTLPADVEYNVRDTLAGVCTLRGVLLLLSMITTITVAAMTTAIAIATVMVMATDTDTATTIPTRILILIRMTTTTTTTTTRNRAQMY
ncbi:CDF zinc ion transporter [Aspergillus terreus]|uniref:Zinc transporter n=1 Tax=Aspergillus terreus TaxID=33178 RepID=A0A5M3YSZ1_ASPTE|nr:hypothetical protein ATETN484_0003084900 [Aspergillus terreus]GFF14835.1 CDF zinc ion transporter [Aspergillus terreus]